MGSFGRAGEGLARRGDEGRDLRFILDSRRALDARGDIDAARAGQLDRFCDIARIEAARQQPRRPRRKVAWRARQSKGRPLPPGKVGVLRRLGVDQQKVRDAVVARGGGEIVRAPRPRSPSWSRRRSAGRFPRPAPGSRGHAAAGCRARARRRCARASRRRRRRRAPRSAPGRGPARRARAPPRNPTWRGLLGKKTKPTMSAPAFSAASRVLAVERPQILTIGVIAASFGQSAPAVKGAASRPP